MKKERQMYGLYSITIGDNDFYNLMIVMSEYICKVLPSYTIMEELADMTNEDIIKDIAKEFMDIVHTSEDIKEYILKRLKVDCVKAIPDEDENSEVAYIMLSGKSAEFLKIQ